MKSNLTQTMAPALQHDTTKDIDNGRTPEQQTHRSGSGDQGRTGGSSDAAISPRHTRHKSRPSADLQAHEKLVRKDSRARKQIPRDSIDKLDDILGSYHHEGPFDATLASRQVPGRAPVEAVKVGNMLALAATPKSNLENSLSRHEPLDGTSAIPSGTTVAGQRYDYEEEDLERQAGLGRWPNVAYDGSDDEGQFERDLGDYNVHHSKTTKDGKVFEMQGARGGIVQYTDEVDDLDDISAVERVPGESSGRTEGGVLSGLKKRLSVKRH